MKKKKITSIVKKRLSAVQVLALGFIVLIFIGGALLSLPLFSRSGNATPFIDALFTSVSAVCVTGLTTVNTALHWNAYGQLIIMILIEIGGLGFMTMPVLLYFILRKKITLSTRILLREALNLDDMSGAFRLMIYVVKLAAIIQIVGAILLSIQFVPEFGWRKGLFFGLFHSISSFCNAGFDLLGDSLTPYQTNPFVLLVIGGLIISGGLGFIVWQDLLQLKKIRRFSLHTKIALITTFSLLVGGFILFFVTEHNASDLTAGTNFFDRLANTFFMSVTPRTAGYYSIDYMQMTNAGLITTIFLMYVGGTPGSTAGGLKTTTFAVLVIQIVSIFKGRTRAEFQGRTIRNSTVFRALTLFFITLTLCVFSIMLLTITENIPESSGIEYVAFEVFSAFGTVGLTMGLTPELSVLGKVIIMLLMYIGRVGIYTVGFSLLTRGQKQQAKYKYPDESVMIG
ncbi:TrkH family potassium uptake protein [Enterococcus haemoperoxidus ATCC BAA-382]|uniref:Trk system potassium uptake protein TrkH n=1 Tax=Enterococcus haemoperoxidus ATCC BAA-382 TaxID=1158608 RepID=R2THY6_9ENTE|nr:TrkH family potassium uptake protein [Enterococcus haemoperoxidus]EOH99734.1 TrkH family potassium uptake protein [Enterococcus haemoperoxidus ATCC BAA-382]EOT62524.1 trk system potassium uptake protein TrkH [Enterococcus haemoperoxidus ATCC BAA-382]OJG54381.1 TrkH family potassium uptake protein [Enterococcus haemoperoxidus]